MKTLTTILFLILIVFSGCQKVVDADKLLDAEEKVYILSYISPTDTLLTVSVSKALPAIGTPLSYDDTENYSSFIIEDAIVSIADVEGNAVQLLYSNENSTYSTNAENLKITEGSQYFLEVITQGETYTSSCKIPKKVATILENLVVDRDEYGVYTDIDISFKDIVGTTNFYIVGAKYEETFEEETYQGSLQFETGGFLTDAIGDGATLNDKTSAYTGSLEEGTSVKLTLQVANVEEVIYQNLRASYLNDDSDGNPFIEYSIAPDNIDGKNGVGVFGGYQLTEKIIEVQY
ncbi:hypothetical protein Celal_1370 [Cellulophaga algicola DSM 14237]|uniref:Lipoprotein n=1 Tax=Cellulophaga algicola (strain DSM 14237 / IC166 / ACAM 630) TaxID=688270 RepID=E6X8T9_CELAD|nr:DUF4249 family protein [Cellulophaga algicola]ADV48684.1 hypothetical protein Celal_1370 [Cellulophaga algicola DSM 14237]